MGKTNELPRAESILKKGLAAPGVRDRLDLLDHLALLYDETGRPGEARELREEFEERLEAGEVACDEDWEEPEGTEVDVFPERGLV